MSDQNFASDVGTLSGGLADTFIVCVGPNAFVSQKSISEVMSLLSIQESLDDSLLAARGHGIPCMIEPVEVYAALATTAVDADFVSLDLSGLIPPGATVAYLEIGIYAGSASAAKRLHIRASGDRAGGFDGNGARFIVCLAAGEYNGRDCVVRLSPDRKIEYKRTNTPGTATWYRINLFGFA